MKEDNNNALKYTGEIVKSPVKAIRRNCLECCCGSHKEVELCRSHNCFLFPFRLGKNPYRKPYNLSEGERARREEKMREILKNM